MTYVLFDTIAALLIIGFAVWGMRRGFIKTFFGLFGFLIAIAVALLFAAPLAALLKEHLVEPALSSFFLKELSNETMQSSAEIDFSALPDSAVALFSRFGISPEALAEQVINAGRTAGRDLAQSIAAFAVSRAATTLSHAIAFISLFGLSSLLLAILARVLDLVAKIPGLHLTNRVFGLIAGIGEGVALAFVFARVLALLEPVMRASDWIWISGFSVDQTYLIRFLASWAPGMN
ncbi:MAG: CvpA family protein [Clostridia bacterium]|nr:CvpA family protein [Clostridia bacterium]